MVITEWNSSWYSQGSKRNKKSGRLPKQGQYSPQILTHSQNYATTISSLIYWSHIINPYITHSRFTHHWKKHYDHMRHWEDIRIQTITITHKIPILIYFSFRETSWHLWNEGQASLHFSTLFQPETFNLFVLYATLLLKVLLFPCIWFGKIL